MTEDPAPKNDPELDVDDLRDLDPESNNADDVRGGNCQLRAAARQGLYTPTQGQ